MKAKFIKQAVTATIIFLIGLGVGWALFHQSKSPKRLEAAVPRLDHVVIIMEENKSYGEIIGNPAAPFINKMAQQYTYASNYYATDRPSEPNYLEIVSGLKSKVQRDCIPLEENCSSDDKNVADDIEAAGKTWKAYQEGMPSPCYLDNIGTYRPKHNPFIYFDNIRNNGTRCNEHDVPYDELERDLKQSSTTPNYIFITPDICNDMHDCPVNVGDKWLAKEVPRILGSPAFTKQKSLLIITWDEDDDTMIGGNAGNHIATIYAGSVVKNRHVTTAYQDHYTIYRTVENALNLQRQAFDSDQVVTDIFNQ